jgi:fructose transport system substrate-binding protein
MVNGQISTAHGTRQRNKVAALVGSVILAAAALAACGSDNQSGSGSGSDSDEIIVGVITKNNFNPYWVAIADGAEEAAKDKGVKLITSVGKSDTDNSSQVTAIENMITRGVSTILITPADNKAIVPAIQKARDAGIQVISLDAATDPEDATDATFATNHTTMGKLIGEWAKAKFEGQEIHLAMLNCDPAAAPCIQRHDGFLQGLGISADDASISGEATTDATIATGQSNMETLLQKDPDINLVYTVSEPVGYGAYQALQQAGKTDQVTLVTIDGSCQGVQFVADGKFAANSQQYPQLMASKGIDAAIEFAETGKMVTGLVDTGEALVTDDPQDGVESMTADDARTQCWGDK